jgi:peptidoglycan/LPS O-acetylase OafA/YrhL
LLLLQEPLFTSNLLIYLRTDMNACTDITRAFKTKSGMMPSSLGGEDKVAALDGVRGLAILVVIMSHLSNSGAHLIPFLNCSGIGKGGVFLFFLLSSFLLTYPFVVKGRAAFGVGEMLRYAERRFFRIYPLYSVYLVCAGLSTYVLTKVMNLNSQIGIPFAMRLDEFWGYFFLLDAHGVAWSIVVEFKFYFLLPFIAYLFVIFLKKRPLLCFVFASLSILTSYHLSALDSNVIANDLRLGPYLPIFIMGSYLAVFQSQCSDLFMKNSFIFKVVLDSVGCLVLIVIALLTPSVATYILGYNVPFNYFHDSIILYGVLWSVLLLSVMNGAGYLRKFFESFALRYLGLISFSAYLIHPVIISIAKDFLVNYAIKGSLIFIITILTAQLSYLFFEKYTSRTRVSNIHGFLVKRMGGKK